MTNEEMEANISRLLIIAENHTVQIGIMMKAFMAVAGLTLLAVVGSVLERVLHLKIVGG